MPLFSTSPLAAAAPPESLEGLIRELESTMNPLAGRAVRILKQQQSLITSLQLRLEFAEVSQQALRDRLREV